MKRVILLSFCIIASMFAMMAQNGPLPIDPQVRYGKLSNGMTYYIRHNELPKDRVEIHIAQNVGAILEEDDQNGLAHFLEHMCFNGTKNFPGNEVVKYCESNGIKFGVDLNAYTSFDRTVYRITNIPTTRESLVDSCMLIIHDWAGALLLEDAEIEKERGVIREEMRTYGDASWRMNDAVRQQILPGNQYGKRNVIGTEEVIMNFKPEALRNYYHKWYRPDLQAVIVVGDIDVDKIEKRIIEMFADIPAAVNPAERINFPVADNAEPLVGIATDREATTPSVSIAYKKEAMPKELREGMDGFIADYLHSIASQIMQERLSDIVRQATPPFINAYVYHGSFANTATSDAWQGTAFIKDNDVETGFKALVREMERVNKYGFSAAEYERAKTNTLTHYETMFNERAKTMSGRYAQEYIGHFTMGDYIPGIETEYNIMNMLAPNVPVEVVNEYVMGLMNNNNIVLTYKGPEAKENSVTPTKAQMLAWLQEVMKEDIQALEETLSSEPLLSELPKGGKIVKEGYNKLYDATEYTLSNGVKVIIKPTDLKDDEILLTATSPGGSSHFTGAHPINIQFYPQIASIGGLGNFNANDLNKVLAGKRVSLRTTIDLQYEGFIGNSNVKDFETLLQLIYLNFTAPRMDEEAFQSFAARIKSQLEAMEANPEMEFYKKLPKTLYVNPERFAQPEVADLAHLDYATIEKWRKDRYADASDFTFILVGNIDPEQSKDLIAQYLGSLPSINRKESSLPVNVDYNKGINKDQISKTMDNPKAIVFNGYWTMLDNQLKTNIEMSFLKQILTIVYQEKIREDEGGTYGVSVSGSIEEYPEGRAMTQISFETEPGKESHLNQIVHDEFKALADNGPRAEDFEKVKEYLNKSFADNIQQNTYWRYIINEYYRTGEDNYTDYLKLVSAVTPADIQKIAKKIVGSGNLIELILVGSK